MRPNPWPGPSLGKHSKGCLSVIALFIAVIAALALAGCGAYNEANFNKVPDSQMRNIRPGNWTRIASPDNFPTIARACYRGDGIYIAQDNTSSVEVIPHDRACL